MFGGLEHIVQQARDVVADGRNRKSFDRLLQAKLHPGSLAHGCKQVAVLLFDLDIDAGAEQVGGGPPSGGQNGGDQEGGEPLVGRAGEGEDDRLDQRVGLGW